MAPRANRAFGSGRSRRRARAAAAVAALGLAVTGCSVIGAVSKVGHALGANRSIINTFTAKLKGGAKTFEATYVTTGSAPATIVYAVRQPAGLLFSESQSSGGSGGSGSIRLIANPNGEYLCSAPGDSGSGAQWTCEKLAPAKAAAERKMLDLYTPAHWVAFLKGFALAAGFAGDKVSTSTMTINGISMSCVDFVATGVPGKSSICTAPQGILGYVKVAGDPSSFELKSYSTSPAASLFQPPPGAKITKVNSAG